MAKKDFDGLFRGLDLNSKGFSKNDLTDDLKTRIPAVWDQETIRKTDVYNTFPNVPLTGNWNANEVRIMPYIKSLYIKSLSTVLTPYSFSTITRGSATIETQFSIFRGSNYDLRTFGLGAVSGLVRYSLTTVPGDVIVFWIDWDASGVAPGEQIIIGTNRSLISRKLYSYQIPETFVTPEIILPTYIPVAMGRELPLSKENLRNIIDDDEPLTRTDITGDIYFTYDSNFNNEWKWAGGGLDNTIPEVPANFPVTVYNRDKNSGALINSAFATVRPVSNKFNATAQKSILMITDSHGVELDRLVAREIKKLIVDNGSFIPTFIGTKVSTADPSVKNESIGGWTTRRFCETGSPFFISGAFNLPAYMANNSFTACDILIIHLGSNDMYTVNNVTTTQYIAYLKQMMASAWAYNPQMKIIVSMPTRGSMRRSDGAYIKTNIVPYIQALKTSFLSYNGPAPYNVPVVVCPSYVVCNRMKSWGEVTASQRDGTGFHYGGQHLNDMGYKRIADIMYSSIMYALLN